MTFFRDAVSVCAEKSSQHTDSYSRIYPFNIIPILVAFLFLGLSCHVSCATTYYVDNVAGNDSFSGTSEASAWKTIKKLNDYQATIAHFLPGDSILFKRGAVFSGPQLVIISSGLEGKEIVFGAYGDTAAPLPIINGSLFLNDQWTHVTGNIYSRQWTAQPYILFYKGAPNTPITTLRFSFVPTALKPNAILLQLDGYYYSLLVTSTTSTTVSGISYMSIAEGKQVYYRQVVNGLEQQWSGAALGMGTPSIDYSTAGLTKPGDWYWHPTEKRIYLYAEELPAADTVAAGYMKQGIWVVSSNDVIIQDINIQKTNGKGLVLYNSSRILVQGLNVSKCAFNGIQLFNSSNNTIRKNTIETCGAGISMYAAPGGGGTSNNGVLANVVTNIRGAGITLARDNALADVSGNNISANYINKVNTQGYDGAGVYTLYAGGSLPSSPDNIIQGNWIHNCGSSYLRSAGIMVDNGIGSMTIINNLVENNSKGGIVVSGAGHNISNNTLRNNGVSSWINAEIIFFNSTTFASDCIVRNNTMEVDHNHHFIYVNPGSSTGHKIDYNTYRYRGYSTKEQFYWPSKWMNFKTWKNSTPYDANSTLIKLPDALTGIYLLL